MRLREITAGLLTYSYKKNFKRIGYLDAPFQGKGSHVTLYKDADGTKLLVIIPKRGSGSDWNLMSIMKQAWMEREEFLSFSHQLIGPLPVRDDGASFLY